MGKTFGELTDTLIGPISFIASDDGLERVAYTSLRTLKDATGMYDVKPSMPGLETVGTLLGELNAYLHGLRKVFSVEINWAMIVGFQRLVLKATTEIPYGSLLTYAELAVHLGKKDAARAVGMALSKNPMPLVIPCHRVIGSDGQIRGYSGGIERKITLLGLEGHRVDENNRIIE